PDFPRGRAFLEEEHHGLDARAEESATWVIEHAIAVAAFQEKFAQAHGSVVAVREESVFDDHATAAPGLEHLDEVLEEEKCGLAGADGEVLLNFLALLAPDRG